MVRRLLQRLDQVVPILGIYGPQRAFAYALKDRRDKREMLLVVLLGPSKHITNTAQHTDASQQIQRPNTSSKYGPCAGVLLFTKPPVHTANDSHIPEEDNAPRNEY